MNEFLLIANGTVFALCAMLAGASFHFARRAQTSRDAAVADALVSMKAIQDAASAMVEAHNALVTTQAEQGKTIDRLQSELAGKSLTRR